MWPIAIIELHIYNFPSRRNYYYSSTIIMHIDVQAIECQGESNSRPQINCNPQTNLLLTCPLLYKQIDFCILIVITKNL